VHVLQSLRQSRKQLITVIMGNMTLKEYLNQKEPVRGPRVYLNKREYKKGPTIKFANGDTLTRVFIIDDGFIKAFPELRNEYVQKNGWERLYTTDSDGNPKNSSCFFI
jgi:hypothetical protein